MERIFLIPVLVIMIELVLSRWWISIYYKKGIIIFKKAFHYDEDQFSSIDSLSDDLTFKFHRVALPAILFEKLSENEIAFRECFLHFYLYVMRGLIRIDRNNRKVFLIGHINWYIPCLFIVFVVYIVTGPLNFSHLRVIIGLFLLILIIFYICIKLKFRLYNKILKYLENKHLKLSDKAFN